MKRNLVILIVLLIFAPCGCLGVLGLLLKAIGRTATSGQKEAPEYKYGEEWRFGDLGVLVEGREGGWRSVTAAGRDMYHDTAFVVRIKFKSYNPNRELYAASQGEYATLTDDIGNTYHQIRPVNEIGVWNRIENHLPPGTSRGVRSDATTLRLDVLVFSRPLPGASAVTLTLDASRYGGKGKISITIPRDRWEKRLFPEE